MGGPHVAKKSEINNEINQIKNKVEEELETRQSLLAPSLWQESAV